VPLQHTLVDEHKFGIKTFLHLTPSETGGPDARPFLFLGEGFYGMARPSFRRCRLAGGSDRGVDHEDCSVVIVRRRARRDTLIDFVGKLPACMVGMEACCGAHHLGRLFAAQGHDVRLMSPEYVRPYVKAQKNDDRDAEGIAEAATRPTMRFVELKTPAQLDMQTLHRSRDRLVAERTALINPSRAILLERGIVVPQGKRKLEQHKASGRRCVANIEHNFSIEKSGKPMGRESAYAGLEIAITAAINVDPIIVNRLSKRSSGRVKTLAVTLRICLHR
jgi:hypothetical protein